MPSAATSAGTASSAGFSTDAEGAETGVDGGGAGGVGVGALDGLVVAFVAGFGSSHAEAVTVQSESAHNAVRDRTRGEYRYTPAR